MLPSQMILTALCFILSVFFDDIDGKFARATGQTSFFGAGLDLVIDLLNHTLGLILFGLVLGARTGSLVPFLVLCPFAFFMGALHINALARTFTPTPGEKEDDPACFGSAWRTFCDARGLVYNPYSLYEVYLLIVLVGPWLERPAVFFAGVIAVFFLLCVIRRVMLVRAASRTGQEGVAC
jgi:phosphatidylglycerophosphate synthase